MEMKIGQENLLVVYTDTPRLILENISHCLTQLYTPFLSDN